MLSRKEKDEQSNSYTASRESHHVLRGPTTTAKLSENKLARKFHEVR